MLFAPFNYQQFNIYKNTIKTIKPNIAVNNVGLLATFFFKLQNSARPLTPPPY